MRIENGPNEANGANGSDFSKRLGVMWAGHGRPLREARNQTHREVPALRYQ